MAVMNRRKFYQFCSKKFQQFQIILIIKTERLVLCDGNTRIAAFVFIFCSFTFQPFGLCTYFLRNLTRFFFILRSTFCDLKKSRKVNAFFQFIRQLIYPLLQVFDFSRHDKSEMAALHFARLQYRHIPNHFKSGLLLDWLFQERRRHLCRPV